MRHIALATIAAVDAQRRERGMMWADLSKELRISTSTIRSMTKRKWGIELDGVIGLTR
jgi:ribosome-binding protein aMBF1 (putative translation factor)